jgi:hypothetical protein
MLIITLTCSQPIEAWPITVEENKRASQLKQTAANMAAAAGYTDVVDLLAWAKPVSHIL